jgi:hypothetical protein
MNPAMMIVGFALGAAYGRMAPKTNTAVLAASGIILAVLLANYPYYDPGWFSTTYIAALAGVWAGSRGNK